VGAAGARTAGKLRVEKLREVRYGLVHEESVQKRA
jgi:hypothetical protein